MECLQRLWCVINLGEVIKKRKEIFNKQAISRIFISFLIIRNLSRQLKSIINNAFLCKSKKGLVFLQFGSDEIYRVLVAVIYAKTRA